MKPAIAFDLDGTLIDVSVRDYKIYSDIIKELGGQPINYEFYWPMRRAKSDIHEILRQSGIIEPDQIEFFLSERNSRMEMMQYLKYDNLFSDTINILSVLAERFEILILTTRHNKTNTLQQINTLGLGKYNAIIVDGNKNVAMSKIQNLQVMVGDTENDIIPANQLFITSVAITTGIRNKNKLEEYKPAFIINHLNELTKII